MLHLDDVPHRSREGRLGIICPCCKNWVFGAKGIEDENKTAKLEWRCVHCSASFSSNPPFEEPGEDKESLKEKIVLLLLAQGNCEAVVRIFATSTKRPPEFIEEELRNLLKTI